MQHQESDFVLCKVIADSINCLDERLTTFEIKVPRYIWPQVLTHRMFSRNGQSSRGVPISFYIKEVETNTVLPTLTSLQKGMVGGVLEQEKQDEALKLIRDHSKQAVELAKSLEKLGVHKQNVNRYLEPFSTITAIISTCYVQHFLDLRLPEDAQPEIQTLANAFYHTTQESTPVFMSPGQWHLPYIRQDDTELSVEQQFKVSAGRCARVSYLTHDGKRDPIKDISLADMLINNKHMSPFEHQAMCAPGVTSGNFRGWAQLRKMMKDEFNATY